jgi:hypothetical protein
MTDDAQFTAYLLSIAVSNDRGIREVGPPRNQREWGIGRLNDYLRAVGREASQEGGEEALWELLRGSVALMPSRRGEALRRLIQLWGAFGWLDDQNVPAPTKPTKYRLPAA